MALALVTGATGFLGGHLVNELLERGHQVRALYRSPSTLAAIGEYDIETVRGDVLDRGSLEHAMQGVDWVFHVAASTASWKPKFAEQTAINVGGTENVVAAALAAGVKRLIHTSSVAVYGFTDDYISERSPHLGLQSWVNYSRTKALGEAKAREGLAKGLDVVIVNPTHILGPGDTQSWGRLILLVDQRKLPGVPPGSGAFVDVREVAKAQVTAAERARSGESFLLGGEEATFLDLVQRIGAMLGKPAPKRAVPALALRGYARAVDAWSRITGKEPDLTPESVAFVCHHMRCDCRKAQTELGLQATPLDRLLGDTIAWMRQQRLLSQ
mgnify:CR=1 FL=1